MGSVLHSGPRRFHRGLIVENKELPYWVCPYTQLSRPRYKAVFHGLIKGGSEKQIAYALGISRNTVHVYVTAIYRHFDVNSRGELLAIMIREFLSRVTLQCEPPTEESAPAILVPEELQFEIEDAFAEVRIAARALGRRIEADESECEAEPLIEESDNAIREMWAQVRRESDDLDRAISFAFGNGETGKKWNPSPIRPKSNDSWRHLSAKELKKHKVIKKGSIGILWADIT